MKTLSIALTKGRLEDKTVERLEQSGLNCEKLKDKGRKLIITIIDKPADLELRFVFAKANDVVTYVEYGVCDAGIVGKDTLCELDRPVYEIKDLRFGKCRFALAAKNESNFYEGYDTKVIATKYPNVAKKFFQEKHMDVEIVKIEGSVELAPLLGLSDGIIDIVETGATLKENGLKIVEYVSDISARLIVNTASLKLKKAAIENFSNRL